MRGFINKKSSTKAERIFAEILKRQRIPFQYKAIIQGKEVDFLIGRFAVEINGHDQSKEKNKMLLENGYIPVNYSNSRVLLERDKLIKNLWQQTSKT